MPILTEEERLGVTVAGRYRLDSVLGRGGTGVVFEAAHTWTGRSVAVKLLRPEYSRDLGLVRRFLQEARAAASVEHPNVVQVLDMGSDEDGTVFLVLERLEGEPLSDYVARRGRLSDEEAISLLMPIMSALEAFHQKGIVHRDLKPDNIFLQKRNNNEPPIPKLLDFGMAKINDAAWGHATQSGVLMGTPYYMSPEQARGERDLGPATDIWSLGVIFYRCLTGRLPFEAPNAPALLMAIVQQPPDPVSAYAPEVSPIVAEAVERAITADRSIRFSDMHEFIEALRGESSGPPIPLVPFTTHKSWTSLRALMVAGTAAALLLLGIGTWAKLWPPLHAARLSHAAEPVREKDKAPATPEPSSLSRARQAPAIESEALKSAVAPFEAPSIFPKPLDESEAEAAPIREGARKNFRKSTTRKPARKMQPPSDRATSSKETKTKRQSLPDLATEW